MEGLMMNTPLTLQVVLERARLYYAGNEIVTRIENGYHRYTYGDFYARVLKLASALKKMGIGPGDRVATFAWNNYRHLELYFAVPCLGAVIHTLNIRLAADQLIYIANHAEDKALFYDPMFHNSIQQLKPHLKSVEHYVAMDATGAGSSDLSYEELLESAPTDFEWPQLDEKMAAGLCYTSGTTGHPKGVLYSHRSLYLHTLTSAMANCMGITESDTCMPIVPMFHANAWGLPYTCALVGAKQVMPAQFMHPADLLKMIVEERVTMTGGVPTIWIGMMQVLEKQPVDLSHLKLILIGGSAVPESMMRYFDAKYQIPVLQAWGMTETSPLGSVSKLKHHMNAWSYEEQLVVRLKQGVPAAGIEIRAVDEAGSPVPWDGKTLGELQVRGPWVASAYFNTNDRAEAFRDGWFSTGDVVTIDREGYICISDRTKDLIKSGGEWISSVDMENSLLGHPKIKEAVVIAVPHEKWVERPLACVVVKPGERLTAEEVQSYLKERFASWWLPDAVEFIDEVPKTSVGKFDKKVLRERFKDYKLPEKQR